MAKVRMGVIGVAGMGGAHAGTILSGKVRNCKLTAVCDVVAKSMATYEGLRSSQIRRR